MIRYVIYARVSTDLESQEESFKTQTEELKTRVESFPDKKDWVFIRTYGDKGISGTKGNRPQFQQMLSDAHNNEFDYVVVKNMSRLARKTSLLLNVLEELDSCGVKVFFTEENRLSSDTDSKLLIPLLGAIAEMEASNTRSHIQETFAIKRASGQMAMPHKIPYGYNWNSETKTIEIDPEQASVVKQVFTWFVDDNLSTGTIARKLNLSGVQSSRNVAWTRTAVQYMLKNPKYNGEAIEHIKATGEPFHFPYPRIIDELTFNKVEGIFDQRSKQKRVVTMKGKATRNFSPSLYPLSGKCSCLYCGGKTTRLSKHPESKKMVFPYEDPCNGRPYWACFNSFSRTTRATPHKAYAISEYYIYKMIHTAIMYLADNTSFLDDKIQEIKTQSIINTDFEKQMEVYKNSVQALESEKKRYIKLYTKGQITESESDAQLARINRELAKLQEPKLPREIISSRMHIEKFIENARDKMHRAEDLSAAMREPEMKRHIMTALVEHIDIGGEPKYQIRIKFYGVVDPVIVQIENPSPITRMKNINGTLKKVPIKSDNPWIVKN